MSYRSYHIDVQAERGRLVVTQERRFLGIFTRRNRIYLTPEQTPASLRWLNLEAERADKLAAESDRDTVGEHLDVGGERS